MKLPQNKSELRDNTKAVSVTNRRLDDVPLIMDTLEQAYTKMHELNSTMNGHTSFSLLMVDDGKLKLWVRQQQPCYGELRKYGASHPKDMCTRPDDRRPTDLWYPFPETGTPIAVGVSYDYTISQKGYSLDEGYVRAIFDKSISPWAKGISNEVDFTTTPDKSKINGMLFKGVDVDPTIFVNALKMGRNSGSVYSYYDKVKGCPFTKLIGVGASPKEALVISSLISNIDFTSYVPFAPGNGYTLAGPINFKRFWNAEPNDLSGGGTLKGLIDYNRPQLHEVFKSPKDGVNFATYINNYRARSNGRFNCINVEELLVYSRAIIRDLLAIKV